MPNVNVKVTADIVDYTAKMALLKAQSTAASAELNKLAREAAKTGLTDTLKPQLTAAAEAAAQTRQNLHTVSEEMERAGGKVSEIKEISRAIRELAHGDLEALPTTFMQLAHGLGEFGPLGLAAVATVTAVGGAFVYLETRARAAYAAESLALGAATFANIPTSRADIDKVTQSLMRFGNVTQEQAEKAAQSLYSIRGANQKLIESIAVGLPRAAQGMGGDLQKSADLIRNFLQDPIKNGPAFVDSVGASAAQIKTFYAEASKGGQAAAVTSGLHIFLEQTEALDKKLGTTEQKLKDVAIAAIARPRSMMEMEDPGFGAREIQESEKAVNSFRHSLNADEAKAFTAAIQAAADATARLGPSAGAVEQGLNKIESTVGLSRSKMLTAEITYLEQQRGLAKNNAERIAEIDAQLGAKRAELAAESTKLMTAASRLGVENRIAAVRNEAAAIIANDKITAEERLKEVTALWQKFLAGTKLNAAERSNVEREAASEQTQIRKSAAQEAEQITKLHADEETAASKNAVELEKADLDLGVAYFRITVGQKIAALRQLTEALAKAEIDKLELEQEAFDPDTAGFEEWEKKIEAARQKLSVDLAQLNQQDAQNLVSTWKQAIDPIEGAFNSMLDGLLEGNETFGQATDRMLLRVVEDWISARLKIEFDWIASQMAMSLGANEWMQKSVMQHLFGETVKAEATVSSQATQTAATVAGATTRLAVEETSAMMGKAASATAGSAQIMGNAYKAASGAYAAVAEIPYVGPALAPIAAATAFAAVAAFDVLTGAERGEAMVDRDGARYTLHYREAVMPRYIADPMRDFFARPEILKLITQARIPLALPTRSSVQPAYEARTVSQAMLEDMGYVSEGAAKMLRAPRAGAAAQEGSGLTPTTYRSLQARTAAQAVMEDMGFSGRIAYPIPLADPRANFLASEEARAARPAPEPVFPMQDRLNDAGGGAGAVPPVHLHFHSLDPRGSAQYLGSPAMRRVLVDVFADAVKSGTRPSGTRGR